MKTEKEIENRIEELIKLKNKSVLIEERTRIFGEIQQLNWVLEKIK